MHLSAPPPSLPRIRGVRLTFDPSVDMAEASDTLELARLAAESLHGAERVELDAKWAVDVAARSIALDTTTKAGRTLAIVFLGLVKREFGTDQVHLLGSTGVAR